MNMASSPEAFLLLRSQFVRTHATLSVCQYVLGIGDRHLSNFMVDLETGGMVGIDFGHAFGSATQVSSLCKQQHKITVLPHTVPSCARAASHQTHSSDY